MIKRAWGASAASAFVAMGLAAGTQAAILSVDFGVNTLEAPGNWNQVTAQTAGFAFTDGIDSTGAATNVDLELITPFVPAKAHANGATGVPGFPDAATIDGWHNNAVIDNVLHGRFHGLLPGQSYDFTFFASEFTAPSEARKQSVFRIGSESAALNWSMNTTEVAVISGAIADANGIIDFYVDNNGMTGAFAVINALQIEGDFSVPEPASLGLIGVGVMMIAVRRRR